MNASVCAFSESSAHSPITYHLSPPLPQRNSKFCSHTLNDKSVLDNGKRDLCTLQRTGPQLYSHSSSLPLPPNVHPCTKHTLNWHMLQCKHVCPKLIQLLNIINIIISKQNIVSLNIQTFYSITFHLQLGHLRTNK